MTVNELKYALMGLEAAGHGDTDVCVWQYSGGNDELCDVKTPTMERDSGVLVFGLTYRD